MVKKSTDLSEEKLYQLSLDIDTILLQCIQDFSISIQSKAFKKSILKAYKLNSTKLGTYILEDYAKRIDLVYLLANSPINFNDTDQVLTKFKKIQNIAVQAYYSKHLFLYYLTKIEKFGENIKYQKIINIEFLLKYLDYLLENLNENNIEILVAIFSLDVSLYVNFKLDRINEVKILNQLSGLIEKSKDFIYYKKIESSLLKVVRKYPSNKSSIFLLGTFYYYKDEESLAINYYTTSCKIDDLFHEYKDSKHLYTLLFRKKKYDRIIELSRTYHVSYIGNQEPYYLIYRILSLIENKEIDTAYNQIEMFIRNHYLNKKFVLNHLQTPLLFGGIIYTYLIQKYKLQFIDFLPISHKEYKTIEALSDYLEFFNIEFANNAHFYLLKAKTCEVLGKYQEAKKATLDGYNIDSSNPLFFNLILIYESRLNGCRIK